MACKWTFLFCFAQTDKGEEEDRPSYLFRHRVLKLVVEQTFVNPAFSSLSLQ